MYLFTKCNQLEVVPIFGNSDIKYIAIYKLYYTIKKNALEKIL